MTRRDDNDDRATAQHDLTRRSFLARTGRTALAAGVAGAMLTACDDTTAQAQQQQSTGEGADGDGRKLGFAFVGLGSFATRQLMPSVEHTKHCRIAALVSGSPAKARSLAQRYNVPERSIYNYENYDAIADNPDVDVIYIVLPNGMHAEYTIRGHQAGKHVLCEKPMAVSVEECRQMIAAAEQAQKKLMVGYRVRYEPVNQRAIAMARNEVGRIVHIAAGAGFPMRDPGAWRLDKQLAGGGALLDIGIYSLNACRYLTGEEPIEVSAMTHAPANDPRFAEVEATCTWQMKFPGGALSNCSTSYDYVGENYYRVLGSDGWFELDPATNYGGNRMYVGGRWGRRQPVEIAEINQFAATMDHMAECVLNDTRPLTPGEEGLRDLRVIEAIYESANAGRTVKLEPMEPVS